MASCYEILYIESLFWILTVGIDSESIQDYATESLGSTELSNYEEYSRQELPRVFRGALEAAVNEQAQPIEDGLRNQLVNMIQECQNYVFSTYRSRLTSNLSISSWQGTSSDSAPALNSRTPMGTEGMNWSFSEEQEGLVEMLQTFYQEPPYQINPQSTPEFNTAPENFTDIAGQNLLSDSGYTSELSVLFSSDLRDSETSTIGTSLVSSSQAQQLAEFGAYGENRPPSLPMVMNMPYKFSERPV